MESMNVQLERNVAWQQSQQQVHIEHRRLRHAFLSKEQQSRAKARFGAERFRTVMESGLAGITASKLNDVKCCHAQLADHLVRSGGDGKGAANPRNLVGEAVLEELERRGVDVRGCDGCEQQCNGESKGWRYYPSKGKLRLLSKRASGSAQSHDISSVRKDAL